MLFITDRRSTAILHCTDATLSQLKNSATRTTAGLCIDYSRRRNCRLAAMSMSVLEEGQIC